MCVYTYIYIYINAQAVRIGSLPQLALVLQDRKQSMADADLLKLPVFVGKRDFAVGNPHRASISQFELFELILLLKSDKRLSVEQFEAKLAICGSSISVSITPPS